MNLNSGTAKLLDGNTHNYLFASQIGVIDIRVHYHEQVHEHQNKNQKRRPIYQTVAYWLIGFLFTKSEQESYPRIPWNVYLGSRLQNHSLSVPLNATGSKLTMNLTSTAGDTSQSPHLTTMDSAQEVHKKTYSTLCM